MSKLVSKSAIPNVFPRSVGTFVEKLELCNSGLLPHNIPIIPKVIVLTCSYAAFVLACHQALVMLYSISSDNKRRSVSRMPNNILENTIEFFFIITICSIPCITYLSLRQGLFDNETHIITDGDFNRK